MTTSIVLSQPTDVPDVLHDDTAFARVERMAQLLARSQLLPAAFRGKPEDVFFAFLIAQQMRVDVFTVLQSIHFVNGKPGWSAPFLISRANASGVFEGEIAFETTGEGPTLAVEASATLRKDGKRVSRKVSLAMAKADGWTKNGKYSSIPEQMLSYRAATFLIRLYCPGILYGLRTSDEVEDIEAVHGRTVDPEPVRVAQVVEDEAAATKRPRTPKARVIDAEPTPEDRALAEDVEAARRQAETQRAEEEERVERERKSKHHPSWEKDRASFFGEVSALGLNGDIACAAIERASKGIRPSAMDPVRRSKSLAWLSTDAGAAAYDAIVVEREQLADGEVSHG